MPACFGATALLQPHCWWSAAEQCILILRKPLHVYLCHLVVPPMTGGAILKQ